MEAVLLWLLSFFVFTSIYWIFQFSLTLKKRLARTTAIFKIKFAARTGAAVLVGTIPVISESQGICCCGLVCHCRVFRGKLHTFETFHLFSRLPVELRLRVVCHPPRNHSILLLQWLTRLQWQYSMPSARTVEIEYDEFSSGWFSPKESRHKPCGLYGANKESRHEYLEVYSPLLQYSPSGIPDPSVTKKELSMVYFNVHLDTLYISSSCTSMVTVRKNPGPQTQRHFEMWFPSYPKHTQARATL